MTYNYQYQDESGNFAPKVLVADGLQIINPSRAMYEAAGYHYVVQVPSEPTEEEVAEMQRQARIAELKQLLAESDYKAIKYAEGWLTADEYADTKAQRQAWRNEINELEGANEQ
jgi:hypothetical protein